MYLLPNISNLDQQGPGLSFRSTADLLLTDQVLDGRVPLVAVPVSPLAVVLPHDHAVGDLARIGLARVEVPVVVVNSPSSGFPDPGAFLGEVCCSNPDPSARGLSSQ